MIVQPFDKCERDDLLRRHAQAMQQYAAARTSRNHIAASGAFAKARQESRRYFDRIHRVPMSACPMCGRVLYRTFDAFGFDGHWWSKSAETEEPPACPHFCLLRGAVNLNGVSPDSGNQEVCPGPEVPYVIPRILDMPGMVMVIGRLDMECGYTAFPLAYFAARRPPRKELTSEWARSIFTYRNAAGEGGWSFPNDPWDFDLAAWLAMGKIRWCELNSNNERLCDNPPDACPYVNLRGERADSEIRGSTRRLIGTPDGLPIYPLE